MDLIKADYILEIVKQGSFSKASEKLYIAQPSLSRYIKELEEKIGLKIFIRSKSQIILTEAGKKIVEYINKSQFLKEELISNLKEIKNNNSAEIKIGIISWLIQPYLKSAIPEFKKLYPNIDFILIEKSAFEMENLISKDKIDACITNGPLISSILDYQVLNYNKMVLAVPKNSQIALENYDFKNNKYINKTINLKSIEDQNIILVDKNSRVGKISREIIKYHKINQTNIVEVTNLNTAMTMSSAGLGITFLPETFILKSTNDTFKPIYFSLGEPEFSFPIIIVYKSEKYNDNNNYYLKLFIDFLKNYKLV